MKSVFRKDMTVEEIKQAADEQSAKLWEVNMYLNEDGKAASNAHHIISWEATFSETIEELVNNLIEHIENEKVNDKVERNIRNFIKNYLQ